MASPAEDFAATLKPGATAEEWKPAAMITEPGAIDFEVGAPVALEPTLTDMPITAPLVEVSAVEEDVRVEEPEEPTQVWEPPPLPVVQPTRLGPPPGVALPPPARLRAEDSEELQRFLSWETGETLSSLEEALTSAALREGVAIHQDGAPSGPILDTVPRISMDEILGTGPAAKALAPATTWTLTAARANLASAPGRDEIIDTTLRFALKSFDYAAALAVRNGTAFGWAALGLEEELVEGNRTAGVHKVALPLDVPRFSGPC